MDEIWQTINHMVSLSSPGSDGMPALFYMKCWNEVGAVSYFLQSCFASASFPTDMNHTHLTLIPKVYFSGEYRPIALWIILYKIIAKILAQRLKSFLNDLIDKAKYAFLPGSIIDNIVTTKELIHSMSMFDSIVGSFALKIDIRKACDRVSWKFLSQCLISYGIVGHTHNLIMQCVYPHFFYYGQW